MKSVKERNEAAFTRMKDKYQDYISQDAAMTIKDVLEFGSAVLALANIKKQIDAGEYTQIGSFLLAVVDTQTEGIGKQPRYKLVTKYDWAMKNAVRDWNNRYEMGK